MKSVTEFIKRRKTTCVVFTFIFINILKLSLFDYFLLGDRASAINLLYKALISAPLVVLAVYLLFKLKSKAGLISFYVIQTIYILANMAYYTYFHSYMHITQWVSLLFEGFTVAKNLSVPLDSKMLLVLIDLPIFIYIFSKFPVLREIRFKMKKLNILAVCVATVVLVFAEISYYGNDHTKAALNQNITTSETLIVEKYGTMANQIVNTITNNSDKELPSKLKYGEEQTSVGRNSEKPNIILIQVEALDGSIIDTKYNGEFVTPYLNSLSNSSVYYPYTLSYHMGGGTSDAEFSAMNSIEPLENYPAIKIPEYDFHNSFVKRLADNGYDALAFHGNSSSFFSRNESFAKMGFSKFWDINALGLTEKGWGASDKDVFNETLKVLENTKQPFYSHIITMSSHLPYTNVLNYENNALFDGIKDEKVRNYFNSMRYVDSAIKSFTEKIKATYKNSYIIIMGDHLSGITEDEYTQSGFILDNRFFEFVPLFIITPDQRAYKEQKEVASFLDISPTVLNVSGIPFSVLTNGHNLLNLGEKANKVPYKQFSYDRDFLFNKVNSQKKP